MWRSTGVALLAFASLSLPAGWVSAQTEEPEALIRQGIALRRAGEDARAYGYFKRAYEISKTPRTTAQLGLASQAVGKFSEAELLLSAALETDDPWVQQNRAA